MKFLVNILNKIVEIAQKEYVYPIIILLLITVILIIYQRFYSMSCPNNECMEWKCVDPNTEAPLDDIEFSYRLYSSSGFGIFKGIFLGLIALGFIVIAITFAMDVPALNKYRVESAVNYRPHIIGFTFLMGFIYFCLVWWSRTCGQNENGDEIPVALYCDNQSVEWESKYTKITGLLVFLIIFFVFLEIWNILKNFTNILGTPKATITNLSQISPELRNKYLGKGGVCGMRSDNKSKLECIKNLEGLDGGKKKIRKKK
jgi:hypothetical protein